MAKDSGDKMLKIVVYGIGIFFVLYNLIAWLAPIAMLLKLEKLGKLIYIVYSPLCHQLPERSTFIGGPKLWPTEDELYNAGYEAIKDDSLVNHITEGRDFVGNDKIGYKVAFCSRDIGIYLALIFVMALVFLTKIQFQKVKVFFRILLLFPMALDGGIQLISTYLYELRVYDHIFYQSNNFKRVLTGAMFGIGVALLLFPYVKEELNADSEVAEYPTTR